MRALYPNRGLGTLCGLFGVTRQAYYTHSRRSGDKELRDLQVLRMVREVREVHPRMGTRKIYELISPELSKMDIKLGRDKLFDILSDNQLLVRNRRRRVSTTQSYHHFKKHKNLINEYRPSQSGQLWVSDITYVETTQRYCYLFLITDAYSRKIVGYKLSDSLETKNALTALKMALRSCPHTQGLIHHSDRGIQYCSHAYVKLCQDNGIRLSMTQDGNPLDNSIAERVNGILKNEYLNEQEWKDFRSLKKAMSKIIHKYNQLRPHLSCNMMTPNVAHLQSGQIKKRWKAYYRKPNNQTNSSF